MLVDRSQLIADLFRHIARFFAQLEPKVRELDELDERRLVAFAVEDFAEVMRINELVTRVDAELRLILPRREELIALATRLKIRGTDLRTIMQSLKPFAVVSGPIAPDAYRQMQEWLKQFELTAWKLRRDSWSNWYFIQQADRAKHEMRILFAQGTNPRKRDVFDSRGPSRGGTLLDARV